VDLNRFGMAWARSAGESAREQFAIAGVVMSDEATADAAIGLAETLAYIGDVLSVDQDQVAAEGFVATTYDRERDLLHLDLCAEALPIVCAVIEDSRVFAVSIGADAGEAVVSFGDGAEGRRPPPGFDNVTGRYRHGDGEDGHVEVSGLGLCRSFVVVAVRAGSWSFVPCGG
jgi:hypothetical protein